MLEGVNGTEGDVLWEENLRWLVMRVGSDW